MRWVLASVIAATALGACSSPDRYPTPGPTKPITPALGKPRDYGPVVRASRVVPPISGGTLLLTKDQRYAVAADPDRDRVHVVQLDGFAVRSVALEPGDEPGRLAEDADGRVHVALRGAGALATLDVTAAKLIERRKVCSAPRGVVWNATASKLHVACAAGELVTLPPSGTTGVVISRIGDDLRDVVIDGDHLVLSRFRASDFLVLGSDGNVASRLRPLDVALGINTGAFTPAVAWRTKRLPKSSGVVMLHQRGGPAARITRGGYGSATTDPCASPIVHSAVSVVDASGGTRESPPLVGMTLVVDFDVSHDEERIAFAAAGNWKNGDAGNVFVYETRAIVGRPPPDGSKTSGSMPVFSGGCVQPGARKVEGQAVAVLFDDQGQMIVQTREPAALHFFAPGGPTSTTFGSSSAPLRPERVVTLSSESVDDTGHAIFHLATTSAPSAGIACASCHPEGGDDGRVWTFEGLGRRRTQVLRGGIANTAPFHWTGDQQDLAALMTEVFGSRMGGGKLEPAQIEVLGRWLDTIPKLQPVVPVDAAKVARGRALYEGSAQCIHCHDGPLKTTNATADVGTGGPFQVPPLLNIRYRAPFLHDGCAKTLLDRFGPCGGGDRHGKTSHLTPAEIEDLVAYLETL